MAGVCKSLVMWIREDVTETVKRAAQENSRYGPMLSSQCMYACVSLLACMHVILSRLPLYTHQQISYTCIPLCMHPSFACLYSQVARSWKSPSNDLTCKPWNVSKVFALQIHDSFHAFLISQSAHISCLPLASLNTNLHSYTKRHSARCWLFLRVATQQNDDETRSFAVSEPPNMRQKPVLTFFFPGCLSSLLLAAQSVLHAALALSLLSSVPQLHTLLAAVDSEQECASIMRGAVDTIGGGDVEEMRQVYAKIDEVLGEYAARMMGS